MKILKILLYLIVCSGLVGCMSQHAHERAIEALESEKEQSAKQIEQLQEVVEESESNISRLSLEKNHLAEDLQKQQIQEAKIREHIQELGRTLEIKDMAVNQMDEENKDLTRDLVRIEEAVVQLKEEKSVLAENFDAQEQERNEQLQRLKKELEAIYQDILSMNHMAVPTAMPAGRLFTAESLAFGDLDQALEHMRATMETQMKEFSQLEDLNVKLENDLNALKGRLQGVEQLKRELDGMRVALADEKNQYAQLQKELQQVQAAREEQAEKFAKVKKEVEVVGEEIERITKALEKKFGKSLIVTQHQDRLVLTMLGQVLFNSGEAELTPLGQKIMRQVGEVLASLPKKNIRVEGHTDNNPIYGRLQDRYATNWELSTARATKVLRYLIEETGMAPNVFAALGYADTRPAASNDTEEGRAQNRRVEIVLYPERNTEMLVNDQVATLTP